MPINRKPISIETMDQIIIPLSNNRAIAICQKGRIKPKELKLAFAQVREHIRQHQQQQRDNDQMIAVNQRKSPVPLGE